MIALAIIIALVGLDYSVRLNAGTTPDKSATEHVTLNAQELENMVNAYRQSVGLLPLEHDERVCVSSDLKVGDMVQKRYFAHDTPNGEKFWSASEKVLPKYRKLGENLAVTNTTSQDVIDGWINSTPHLKNIVDDFTHTCVSTKAIKDFDYGGETYSSMTMIVQHFIAY